MKVKRVIITTLLSFIIIILAGCMSTLSEKTNTAVNSEEKLKEVVLISDNKKTSKNWNLVDIPDKIEIPNNKKDVQVYEEEVGHSVYNGIFVNFMDVKDLNGFSNILIGYHHKEICSPSKLNAHANV